MTGSGSLALIAGLIVVAILLEAAPKWGGIVLVILVMGAVNYGPASPFNVR